MSDQAAASPQQLGMPELGLDNQEAFSALLAEYDRAIARISASHDSLLGKVAELSEEIELKNRLLARQERLAALGEMAAGVAHEIRNPLGGIALYLEILQKDLGEQEGPLAICNKIGSAVSRMNHIVEAILNFTRPFDPQIQELSTKGLLQEVSDLSHGLTQEHQVSLDLDVDDTSETLHGDSSLLHQLLLNLVRNAIEASPKGSQISINTKLHTQDTDDEEGSPSKHTLVQIRDQGQGIAEDDLPKLFTPFFTTKKGGTGLGLALCQRIAEAHGGELRASNHPEGGALFSLSIPHQA